MTKTQWRRGVCAIGIMAAILTAGCSGNERLDNMGQKYNAAALLPVEAGGQDRANESMTAQPSDYPPYRMTDRSFSGSRHVAIEVRHFLVYKDLRQIDSAQSDECNDTQANASAGGSDSKRLSQSAAFPCAAGAM